MTIRPVLCLTSAALAAALSAACAGKRVAEPAAPGGTLVVLLPDEEARTSGRVAVSNNAGTVELLAPYDATEVNATGPPAPPSKMDEAEVLRAFGTVLSNLPAAPERFNLYFENDSSELTSESRALLPVVLKAVANRPVPDVTVIGHTDRTGTTASNFRLGLKRAVAVRGLLVSTGVDASLIQVESHGEGDLLMPTRDNVAEPRNRRVEITVK